MAYNDVIPSWVINDLLKGYQYSLPMYIPRFILKEEYCKSLPKEIHCDLTELGVTYHTKGTQDHPSFLALREHLGANGLIKIERGWVNGDRVLKKFMINSTMFEPGDKFVCASAMHWELFRDG